MRIAAYCRVSTDQQTTDSQRHELDLWLQAHPDSQVTWYVDHGISGKTMKRPALQRMLADIQAGTVDTLLAYRLDRLSRTATDALQLLMDLVRADINVYFTDQPVLNAQLDDPFRLTKLAMFSELAQVERETLVRRVKSGLAAAKARGVRLGAKPQIPNSTKTQIKAARAAGTTFAALAKTYGMSTSTIHSICNG